MSSKYYETNGYGHDFEFTNHCALIVCFITYKTWVWKEKGPSKARLH